MYYLENIGLISHNNSVKVPKAYFQFTKFITVSRFQDLQGSAYTHEPIGGRLHLILYVLFGKYWANFS